MMGIYQENRYLDRQRGALCTAATWSETIPLWKGQLSSNGDQWVVSLWKEWKDWIYLIKSCCKWIFKKILGEYSFQPVITISFSCI